MVVKHTFEIDPCAEVDLNISAKRKPLLENNGSPKMANKKQKTDHSSDIEKQRCVCRKTFLFIK